MSQAFIQDVRQFQNLLNSLYERQVRSCFESSVSTLIKSLEEMLGYLNESLAGYHPGAQPLLDDIPEETLLKVLADPVLAKRMERKGFQWKMSLTCDKDLG